MQARLWNAEGIEQSAKWIASPHQHLSEKIALRGENFQSLICLYSELDSKELTDLQKFCSSIGHMKSFVFCKEVVRGWKVGLHLRRARVYVRTEFFENVARPGIDDARRPVYAVNIRKRDSASRKSFRFELRYFLLLFLQISV